MNLARRGKVHLLLANTDLHLAQRIVMVRDQHAAAILNILQERRRLGLLALADAIETTPRVARRRLDQLVAAGLVASRGIHRPVYELDSAALTVSRPLEAIAAFPVVT